MNPVDLWHLASLVEAEAESVVRSVESTEWDENHLSFLLVQRLRSALLQVGTITGPSTLLRIGAEAYKVSGRPERSHGDIAVVVNHMFVSGRELRGCGFYEAKLEGCEHGYPAFKLRQLRRLVTSTPRLAVLLYNRSPKPASQNPIFSWSDPRVVQHDPGREGTASVSCVGANLVIGMGHLQNALECYGESFGTHFVSRFLAGRDLDFSRSPQDSIGRWVTATKRSAPIVIVVTISHGGEAPLNTNLGLPEYEPVPWAASAPILQARSWSGEHQAHDSVPIDVREVVHVRRGSR